MKQHRSDPSSQWILPERAYAPGHEPREPDLTAGQVHAQAFPWDDSAWREVAQVIIAATLLLTGVGVLAAFII